MFKRILVPVDGSPRSARAIKAAATIASQSGGSLTLFHATPLYDPPYAISDYAFAGMSEAQFHEQATAASAKVLEKAKRIATAAGVFAKVANATSDSPARAILEAARKSRADTIVMASHGRTGLEKLLLGSETQKVLAHAKLPVLVVR